MLVLVALFVQVSKHIIVGKFRGWHWLFHTFPSTVSYLYSTQRWTRAFLQLRTSRWSTSGWSSILSFPLSSSSFTPTWILLGRELKKDFFLHSNVFIFSFKGKREMKIHHNLLNSSKTFHKFVWAPFWPVDKHKPLVCSGWDLNFSPERKATRRQRQSSRSSQRWDRHQGRRRLFSIL